METKDVYARSVAELEEVYHYSIHLKSGPPMTGECRLYVILGFISIWRKFLLEPIGFTIEMNDNNGGGVFLVNEILAIGYEKVKAEKEKK